MQKAATHSLAVKVGANSNPANLGFALIHKKRNEADHLLMAVFRHKPALIAKIRLHGAKSRLRKPGGEGDGDIQDTLQIGRSLIVPNNDLIG
jgi:hypothetical protein